MTETNINIDFVKQLKQQIIQSRYIVAKIANADSLKLYFVIGMAIENEFEKQKWGEVCLSPKFRF